MQRRSLQFVFLLVTACSVSLALARGALVGGPIVAGWCFAGLWAIALVGLPCLLLIWHGPPYRLRFRLARLVQWISAAAFLVTTWLAVLLLSLLAPLFMLAIVALFFDEVESRPAWAVGTLAAGLGIGCGLLWINYRILQRAIRDYRQRMAVSVPDE